MTYVISKQSFPTKFAPNLGTLFGYKYIAIHCMFTCIHNHLSVEHCLGILYIICVYDLAKLSIVCSIFWCIVGVNHISILSGYMLLSGYSV